MEVHVRPNAKKTRIVSEEDILLVDIKAPAENNRANEELERFLSKQYGKKATIIRGKTGRKKVVRLT